MARYKIKSLTMKFNNVSYDVKKIPAGQGVASDPVDVTCLGDASLSYLPGALVNNKEIQAVVNGITDAPAVNTVGSLEMTIVYNNGNADTSKTVTIANCILKDVEPPAAEAGGDRSADWTLTFQPGAASSSGS